MLILNPKLASKTNLTSDQQWKDSQFYAITSVRLGLNTIATECDTLIFRLHPASPTHTP